MKKGLDVFSNDELADELERRVQAGKEAEIPEAFKNPDFSKLIRCAENMISNVADNEGYPGKDHEYYFFETGMECIFGKDLWKWWNKNVNC